MPISSNTLAVERAVSNGAVAVIGQPDRVVRRHVHAVRAIENVLAPRLQEVALAVQHHHRMRAAIEAIDPVPPIDANRGDIAELPAVRQPRPVFLRRVGVLAGADFDGHHYPPVFVRPSAASRARAAGSRNAGSPQPPPPPDNTWMHAARRHGHVDFLALQLARRMLRAPAAYNRAARHRGRRRMPRAPCTMPSPAVLAMRDAVGFHPQPHIAAITAADTVRRRRIRAIFVSFEHQRETGVSATSMLPNLMPPARVPFADGRISVARRPSRRRRAAPGTCAR